ncbi:MAG TPA: 3-oxoacyl-[acyl-carrier-protein] synthase III C-terminal domain-containing protein [Myxococcota bacterium]|nr:3-oxoacyl-[acyl-carrier-protein] synthase III C-terminal domain-containing protein [Myxococcota bacterium]
MSASVGMRSLALSFPRRIRTNDFWRERYPTLVAEEERKTLARLWKANERAAPVDPFELAMGPYLSDPFRGARQRRVLEAGQPAASLELDAARRALDAAELRADEIDLLVCSSFLPDQIGVGNATPLARALGHQGAAWNVETTCSGALVALQNASALVRGGEFETALVIVSCTYSRVADEDDTLCWFLGDGAGAFVVSATPPGSAYLGAHSKNTGATCNTFYYEVVADERGPRVRMDCTPETGRVLAETSGPYLHASCDGAAEAAGVKLSEVDFFVFNTPTAWYGEFCRRALGVPAERSIDTYPEYANVGPALLPVNLYRAAESGRLRPGDLVLVYTVGSVSSAGAAIMRWGDVALGGIGEVGAA